MPGRLVWVLPLNNFAYNTDALSEHNGIVLMARTVSFSQAMQWETLLSSCFPAVSQLLPSKESVSVSSLPYWWGAEAMGHKGTCWRSPSCQVAGLGLKPRKTVSTPSAFTFYIKKKKRFTNLHESLTAHWMLLFHSVFGWHDFHICAYMPTREACSAQSMKPEVNFWCPFFRKHFFLR